MTGREAVELARSGSFDLIILDLMMPKIDGLQACMRIREFSNVPIIMLTARSEDTDKIIGFGVWGGRLHHQALQHSGAEGPGAGPAAPGGHGGPEAGRRPAVHGPHHPWTWTPGPPGRTARAWIPPPRSST